MAKRVMQFRFYSDGSTMNYPDGCTQARLLSGAVFDSYTPILQLGIQSLPGTRFYLNNSLVDPIIIGSTGIYELDVDGLTEITHLSFHSESLETISRNPNASLIVDIVYDDKKEAK